MGREILRLTFKQSKYFIKLLLLLFSSGEILHFCPNLILIPHLPVSLPFIIVGNKRNCDDISHLIFYLQSGAIFLIVSTMLGVHSRT